MSTLAEQRAYVVTATDTGAERLVRAANKARAMRQAVRVRIATADDVERLILRGVMPEGDSAKVPPPDSKGPNHV